MKIKSTAISFICLLLSLASCEQDRSIPLPVEQTRPLFRKIVSPVDSAFAYDREAPIKMQFNEPMDISTFNGNFFLYEDEANNISVPGKFSADGNEVYFHPDNPLLEAHEYFSKLYARVKDMSGNGIDKDTLTAAKSEFITNGHYSRFGEVENIIINGSEDFLSKMFIENSRFTADTVLDITGFGRQLEAAYTQMGDYLLLTDYKSSNSAIYFLNTTTYQIDKSLTQNSDGSAVKKSAEIVVSEEKAYVVNQSLNLVSVIDLDSQEMTDIISLPDTPKGMAISPNADYIYVGSARDNRIWQIDTNTLTITKTYTIENYSLSIRLAVSADGSYLIARENRGTGLALVNIDTEHTTIIDLGYESKPGNNNDLVVQGPYVYVGSSLGQLTKINVSLQKVESEVLIGNLQGLDSYRDGSFLYAVLREEPAKVAVINPENLKVLRRVVVNGKTPWDIVIRPYPEYIIN